ncbi:MAG: hypothetical protein U1E60_27075 [Reyranellaceae bacterium]
MTRSKMFIVTLGALALTVAVLPRVHAQSGQALVLAEQVCLDYGVTPSTAAFEGCLARAARAFDRGQPDIAVRQARATRDAREACLSYELSPETLGYRQCVASEVERTLNQLAEHYD